MVRFVKKGLGIVGYVEIAFKNENYLEAFVFLHSFLEFFMNVYFSLYCSVALKNKKVQIPSYKFRTITAILWNIGQLKQSEYKIAIMFNKTRNRLAHDLFKDASDKLAKNYRGISDIVKLTVRPKELKREIKQGKKLLGAFEHKLLYELLKAKSETKKV